MRNNAYLCISAILTTILIYTLSVNLLRNDVGYSYVFGNSGIVGSLFVCVFSNCGEIRHVGRGES